MSQIKKAIKFHVNQFHSKLNPYEYDEKKYSNTFLTNSPKKHAKNLSQADKQIFVFWTGYNHLTANRKRGLKSLEDISEIPVQLITPNNLSEYILDNHPLHPAYEYLSLVHKSDYLRCYFMHFYGGGYSDIKETKNPWTSAFDYLNSSNNWIIGYPEFNKKDVVKVGSPIQEDLEQYFSLLLGNGAYICKPNTPFTRDWYNELLIRMDSYADKLIKNPGNTLGDNQGYPIPWSNILGDIFHPLCLKYLEHISYEHKIRPILDNYR